MMRYFLFLPLTLLLFSFELFETGKTSIQIKALKKANHNTPFYVLVKPSSFADFLKADYHKLVEEKLTNESQFLEVACIIPGQTELLQIKTPEKDAIAVYFLFTTPGDEWKYFIDKEGPRKIKILVGDNEICATSRF